MTFHPQLAKEMKGINEFQSIPKIRLIRGQIRCQHLFKQPWFED